MTEITIPAPIDCVWLGDWNLIEGPLEVGSVGYWLKNSFGEGPIRPGLDRRPIFVICPAFYTAAGEMRGTSFCIDAPATHKEEDPPDAPWVYWNVTVDMDSLVIGQKPNITVNPSIHLVGMWHGWLQDGQLHQ